jgi:MFS family permease
MLIYFTLTSIITKPEFNNQSLDLFAVYFIGMVVAAIAGSKFPVRARDNLLNIWLLLGTVATFLLVLISSSNPLINGLVITFLGVSIGLGLPSSLSYFAKKATIEKRGSIAGAIWGTVGLSILILGLLISIIGTLLLIVILGVWRLIGSLTFLSLNRKYKKVEEPKSPSHLSTSYLTIIRKKEVLLFLIPWVMFTVINFAEKPILQNFLGANQYSVVESAEFIFIGIFAFIGGLLADIGGRKRVIIAGFVMLGFEYAVLSIAALSGFSNAVDTVSISYVFMTLDGVTWGLLFSVFFTVVWGDLGEDYEKEKFYVLVGVPLLLFNFLSVLITPYAKSIPLGTAFTVASFFLFAAVIPLMYAPETLPEKAMKDRDLKGYAEKALKQAQKEAFKSQKKDSDKGEKEKEKDSEDSNGMPDYEEARKLAEKYY